MDCARFQEVLFVWLDGELDTQAGAEAEAHVAGCDDCRERGQEERLFERRVRKALLADADAEAMIARTLAELGHGGARPPARVFRLVAPVAAVAASLLLVLYGAWFYCIGPFECGYLQALEAAADAPAASVERAAVLDADVRRLMDATGAPPQLPQSEPPSRAIVDVGHGAGKALRYSYLTDAGPVSVICCPSKGMQPSFRREIGHDGETWWLAEENGRRIVAFMAAGGDVLYCVVGAQDEATLLRTAEAVRSTCR